MTPAPESAPAPEGAPAAETALKVELPPIAPDGPLRIESRPGLGWVVVDTRNRQMLSTQTLATMLGDRFMLDALEREKRRSLWTRAGLGATGGILVLSSFVNLGGRGVGFPQRSDYAIDCSEWGRDQAACQAQEIRLEQDYERVLESYQDHRSATSLVLLGGAALAFVSIPWAAMEYNDNRIWPNRIYDQGQLQQKLDAYNTALPMSVGVNPSPVAPSIYVGVTGVIP